MPYGFICPISCSTSLIWDAYSGGARSINFPKTADCFPVISQYPVYSPFVEPGIRIIRVQIRCMIVCRPRRASDSPSQYHFFASCGRDTSTAGEAGKGFSKGVWCSNRPRGAAVNHAMDCQELQDQLRIFAATFALSQMTM